MTNTITFKWNTGNIEIAACAVLDMTAAYLARLVKTATVNADEVKAELSAYIQSEIDKLNPKRDYDKRTIEQYKKLLSVVAEKKQSKREKAVIRIAKNCSSAMAGKYYGIIHDAEKYCVLDGYRMVRYAAPIDGLEDAPCTFDTVKAIGNKSSYSAALVLPTVQEIKADMKIAKLAGTDINHIRVIKTGKRLDFCYDFGYGLPMVNAKYLIDMIEALPDAIAYYNPEHALCNPIYFDGGEDDGILLPVRKMQEYAAPVEEKPIEKPVEAAAPVVKEDPAPEVKDNKPSAANVPTVKNLSQFKKAISAGYAFKIVKHYIKPELSGQIRKPNKIQTNAFYSVVQGEPNNPVSLANDGKGYYLNYGKAGDWDFTGDTIKMYAGGNPVWEITFDLSYGTEAAPVDTVDNTEVEQAAAEKRIEAVAEAVKVNDMDDNKSGVVLRLFKRGFITEDEAKQTLLFPVSVRISTALALPAHEEAVQNMTAQETIQIAAVIHPAVLRPSARHYRRLQFNISSAKNLLKIPTCVCTSLNKYDKINIPQYRRETQCQLKPQSDSSVMMPRPP